MHLSGTSNAACFGVHNVSHKADSPCLNRLTFSIRKVIVLSNLVWLLCNARAEIDWTVNVCEERSRTFSEHLSLERGEVLPYGTYVSPVQFYNYVQII